KAAEGLYRRSEVGIPALPPRCRLAIRAARLIYADIGREIAMAGYDSVSRRAYTTGTRKAVLALRALWTQSEARGTSVTAPALPEAAPFVAAVVAATERSAPTTPTPRRYPLLHPREDSA
ncbi:MAG: squalene/phytoene synthase family protein, partial [Gemmatimonadota bacterium]|nr:squalene/phytoene synthase family protein [Gemmatimonadota bacterium]